MSSRQWIASLFLVGSVGCAGQTDATMDPAPSEPALQTQSQQTSEPSVEQPLVEPVSEDAGSPTPAADSAPPPPSVVWRKANLTHYTSYPAPGSEECTSYNGCTWAGQFAAFPGEKKSKSWVQANNIASVHSKDFASYEGKTLRLRKGARQIDVKVYDMCADSDCSGCCTRNSSETGFLIDLESYTADRFGADDGTVEWTCVDC